MSGWGVTHTHTPKFLLVEMVWTANQRLTCKMSKFDTLCGLRIADSASLSVCMSRFFADFLRFSAFLRVYSLCFIDTMLSNGFNNKETKTMNTMATAKYPLPPILGL